MPVALATITRSEVPDNKFCADERGEKYDAMKPRRLRDVYCRIFKKFESDCDKKGLPDCAVGKVDSGKYFFYGKATRNARLDKDGTGDPYTLKEASWPYSVNKFWRDCENEKRENGTDIPGTEILDWYECVNRTHMAEWMKLYLTNQFTNGRGIELVGSPTGDEFGPVNQQRQFFINDGVERDIFGNTLLEVCFYAYDRLSSARYDAFRARCIEEFRKQCTTSVTTNHLYFCDTVSNADLARFFGATAFKIKTLNNVIGD